MADEDFGGFHLKLGSGRLLACCCSANDVENAQRRAIVPIVVMRDLPNHASAAGFLRSLPAGAYVYSHPLHSPVILDAQLCAAARDAGFLPAGAKVSKVTQDDNPVYACRDRVGVRAVGRVVAQCSSERRRRCVGSGRDVAQPLFDSFPPRDLDVLQTVVDRVQADLDRIESREARGTHLAELAAAAGEQHPKR